MNVKRDFVVIFKDRDWIRKTLLGGFFFMLPPFFILSFGFAAKFIYNRLETGNKELPSWNHWGTLFIKGFEWGLIILFYLAIPVLFLSLLPGSFIEFLVNPRFIISNLNFNGFFILFFSFILYFVAMFFLPMALIIFSDTGSLINAVKFENLYKHIKRKLLPYIFAYGVMILLLGFDFCLHIILNNYVVSFGLIPAYFVFVWIAFIISLVSASLFIESF